MPLSTIFHIVVVIFIGGENHWHFIT